MGHRGAGHGPPSSSWGALLRPAVLLLLLCTSYAHAKGAMGVAQASGRRLQQLNQDQQASLLTQVSNPATQQLVEFLLQEVWYIRSVLLAEARGTRATAGLTTVEMPCTGPNAGQFRRMPHKKIQAERRGWTRLWGLGRGTREQLP